MTVIACDGLPPQIIKPGNSPSSGSNPSNNQGDELNYETLLAYAQELGFQGNLEDLINACKGAQGDSAYEIACKHYNYQGTLEDWLKSLVGAAGKDGETPFIGDNGNWWIGAIDTGVKARGEDGIDGTDGVGIESVTLSADGCLSIVLTDGKEIELGNIRGEVGATGQNGLDGLNGKSAYEIAKDNGYEGSEEEWLQTLIGATGSNGQDGQNGQDGKDGVSPSIGDNGNWWIGNVDTGVKADGTGYQYLKLDSGDYYIAVGSNSRLSTLDIPSNYNNKPIIGIEEEGFSSSKVLTEVTIPASIKWIGKDAFPSTLTKVNFDGSCKEWAEIDIAEPNDSLYNAEIVLRTPHNYVDGVCTICGHSNLEHDILIIEKQDSDYVVTGVKSTDFTEVEIPSYGTKINKGVFDACTRLETFKITDLSKWCEIEFILDDINDHPLYVAFLRKLDNGYDDVTPLYLNVEPISGDIVIPDGVKSIGKGVFFCCVDITSVTIPESVETIGEGAFGAADITSVNIAEGVKVIDDFAFYCCDRLTEIIIPDSVESIGDAAFMSCESLPRNHYR